MLRVEDATPADRHAADGTADVTAKGYDRHVDVSWAQEPGVDHFTIYRSTDDKTFCAHRHPEGPLDAL